MCELLVEQVKKLHLSASDILVARIPNWHRQIPQCQGLQRLLVEEGINNLLLIVDDEADIYIIDEAFMNRCGWYRKGQNA